MAICTGVVLAVLCLLTPPTALAQGGTYHQVAPGESLEDIARRYGVSPAVVASENRLSANSRPVAGTRLFIPGARRPIVSGRAGGTTTTRQAPSRAPSPQRITQPPTTSGGTPRATASLRPRMVTVGPGDSLWKIANENNVSIHDLARANGLMNDARLEIGQVLRVPVRLNSAGQPVNAAPSSPASSSPPQVDNIPGGGISMPSSAAVATPSAVFPSSSSQPGRVSSRGFQWPVEGRVIRGFERTSTSKHVGIDIAAPVGTTVHAAREGTVVYAGSTISAYGNMVIINHDGGLATCYAFCREILVRVDQRVARGQVIARSGDDGPDSRPSLHFQIRRRGDAVDPIPFLP